MEMVMARAEIVLGLTVMKKTLRHTVWASSAVMDEIMTVTSKSMSSSLFQRGLVWSMACVSMQTPPALRASGTVDIHRVQRALVHPAVQRLSKSRAVICSIMTAMGLWMRASILTLTSNIVAFVEANVLSQMLSPLVVWVFASSSAVSKAGLILI
jgi:hypothetical protein